MSEKRRTRYRTRSTSTAEFRRWLADNINDVVVRGDIIYVTSRGRRVAALVPVEVAEAAEREGTR